MFSNLALVHLGEVVELDDFSLPIGQHLCNHRFEFSSHRTCVLVARVTVVEILIRLVKRVILGRESPPPRIAQGNLPEIRNLDVRVSVSSRISTVSSISGKPANTKSGKLGTLRSAFNKGPKDRLRKLDHHQSSCSGTQSPPVRLPLGIGNHRLWNAVE